MQTKLGTNIPIQTQATIYSTNTNNTSQSYDQNFIENLVKNG